MVDGSIMSWVLLSFAVITPMSASIGMAFIRREQALSQVCIFRSTLLSIYSAHAVWDWDKASAKEPTGRAARTAVDWVAYTDKVMEVMAQLCVDMTRWLTLPMASRARHRVTTAGKTESKEIMVVSNQLRRSILHKLAKITLLCEEIKKEGLLPNEATRIRNWERDVAEQVGMCQGHRIDPVLCEARLCEKSIHPY
jgi:hypothetical protein